MTINGHKVTSKEFAFDGCHKIYLINSDEDRKELVENGYEIKPIKELMEAYDNSCGLKFIQNMTTFEDIIPQFAEQE